MAKIENCCVIDDDPIFIYGIKRMMRDIDFCKDVTVYNNGQDALDGLREMREGHDKLPQVIFLDLNMPIMNGWDFLDEFIKIRPPNSSKTLVYVISSSVDPKDISKVNDYALVSNYILKPITPADLEKVLKD
ncbi:response regulator [Maribacter sp. 2307ULW6-5]|uniref:response regulator n=1 Tax=Maribacter sp. 2307ULW6-5 TaxID=3386275 RepID=UPI0039BC6F34